MVAKSDSLDDAKNVDKEADKAEEDDKDKDKEISPRKTMLKTWTMNMSKNITKMLIRTKRSVLVTKRRFQRKTKHFCNLKLQTKIKF